MSSILSLAEHSPIGVGKMRMVFQHPAQPGRVIKVFRPDAVSSHFAWGFGAPGFGQRHREYSMFLREIEEQLALHARREDAYFIERITGLEATDLGLGLVADAILGRDGRYAPTLETLLAEGRFTDQARRDLSRCLEQIVKSDVVVKGLNSANLLYAEDEEHGSHFVLVDGLGERSWFPICSMSRGLNRWVKRRRIDRLMARVRRRDRTANHAGASRNHALVDARNG